MFEEAPLEVPESPSSAAPVSPTAQPAPVVRQNRLPSSSYILIAVFGFVASIWLLHRVDARYLWQDEAMTAVIGERMMHFGRPLGYDGKNLITMDSQGDYEKDVFAAQTISSEKALEYYVNRKDFKPDTTWTGHPWGQFLVAGLSIEMFGKSTFTARLPFVLAAVLTVMVLAEWMERLFRNRLITVLTIVLLLGNVFWFAHMRQCRYYALSCLFTLLTMRFYWGWLEGSRWNAIGMAVSSWILFQSDFGTFFPVVGSLFIYSWLDRSKSPAWILGIFGFIGLSVVPFILFYEMHNRLKLPYLPWFYRFAGELFQINQYILPFAVGGFIYWMVMTRPLDFSRSQRRFLEPVLIFTGMLIIWVAFAAPFPYHRYVVALTPMAAGITAWAVVYLAQRVAPNRAAATVLAVAGAILLLISPILSSPISISMPQKVRPQNGIGLVVRPELALLSAEVFGSTLGDPNGATIEFLRERLRPGDKVLINYEDMPAMFYLDAPVRGGAMCFRVGERETPPPRFIVIRKTAQFFPYQWDVINDFLADCKVREVKTNIPDVTWGYCPDPLLNYVELGRAKEHALVLECFGWKK